MLKQIEIDFNSVPFAGSDYVSKHDKERLKGQIGRIYELMKDGVWRTLGEISLITGDGEASISAQLRNLKKVDIMYDKRIRGERSSGLWEYCLVL